MYQPAHGLDDLARVDGLLGEGGRLELWRNRPDSTIQLGCEDDRDEDISVWKIVLTTRRIDMSSFEQESFNSPSKTRTSHPAMENHSDQWSSISITVIQKRA